MAAPTIQTGNKKGSSASGETTTTVTKPDTAPSGNLVFICMGSDAVSQTFSYDGTFTELYVDETFQSAASASVAYKTSGGSESDYSVTLGTSERQAWQCFSVSGASGINVSPASNNGSSGTATFPAMTTSVADCLGIRVCVTDQNVTSTIPFGAMSGSGWTLLDEVFGTSAGAVGVWYKTLTSSGTEASGTATLNISEQWWTVSFALAPAATDITISKSETATLSESITALLTSNVSKSEAATIAEAITARLESYVSRSETVTLAESVGILLASDISITDSASVGESVALTLVSNVSVSDSATVVESVNIAVSDPQISATDSVTIAESADLTLVSNVSVADAITLAESVAALLESHINKSESVELAEAVNATLIHVITVTEDVAVAESVGIVLISDVGVADGVTLSEAVSAQVATAEISVVDAVSIAESAAVDFSTPIAAEDSVTISELVSVVISTATISVSESIVIAESVTVNVVIEIATADSITVSESVSIASVLTLSVSDSVSLVESVALENTRTLSIQDSIVAAESVSLAISELALSVSDSILLSESASAAFESVSEYLSINVADNIVVTTILTIMRLFSDDTDDDLCQFKIWQKPDGSEWWGDPNAIDSVDEHRTNVPRGTMTVSSTRKYSMFD